MDLVCATPDAFISWMIIRNPWRVFNVIYPTNDHWKLAAQREPLILTEMPIDLREHIQTLIYEDEMTLRDNYFDLNRNMYDGESTESDCESYDDGYDSG